MALPKLEVPTFTTMLPSSKKSVKYRPFLVKEHKVLLMLSDADAGEIQRVVTELIDACTFNKLDTNDLTYIDIVHMFIELRKASLGEQLPLVVNCPCGEAINVTTNLNDVKTVINPEHSPKIRLSRAIVVEMSYPDFDQALDMYKETDPDKFLEMASGCVRGIHENNEFHDAKEYTRQEIQEFLGDMSVSKMRELATFFETLPVIKLDVNTDCPKCARKHNLTVQNLDYFFV